MSELSPPSTDSCHRGRIRFLAGFVLILAACATQRPAPNYKRTQPVEEAPKKDPKPIESHPLGRGEIHVEENVQEAPPLSGRIEIKTWANEVIRGRLVEETRDAYVLDVGTLDAPQAGTRKVPRSAVMELKRLPREP